MGSNEFDGPRGPADPGPRLRGPDHVRREGPGHVIPPDPRHPAAGRRAERPRGPDRRRRVRGEQRLRWAHLHADRGEAGGQRSQVQPLPHDRPLFADARRTTQRPKPPLGRDGRHHRDRDLRPGLQLAPAEHGRAAGRDAQAQRLFDRTVRKVPRGPGLADQSDGPVRQLAVRRRRLRVLLRLHRRRDEPVRAGHLPQHDTDRARPNARGGLPLHRGHDRQGDRLGPPAEGAHVGQAVLRLLRARRDPRPASCPAGMVGPVQGQVRRRAGTPFASRRSHARRTLVSSPPTRS